MSVARRLTSDALAHGAEGVEGTDKFAGEAASAMAGVIEHDKLAVRPGAMQARADKTVTGPLAQAPIKSRRPSGRVHNRHRTGRRITPRTAEDVGYLIGSDPPGTGAHILTVTYPELPV
jgi:hypothetical protein